MNPAPLYPAGLWAWSHQEHCTLTVSALTYWTHSRSHSHTHTHASMHTHKRVNALTQTRESPMERLFRGITWLPGNSVALPRRPSYFRLLICLFLCVCLRVCLSSIRFSCPYNMATVPSCFSCILLYFMPRVCVFVYVFVCVCVCVTVSDLRGK